MEATLQPLVEEIRREFFGAVSAPFLSYEKAVEWLRSREDKPVRASPDMWGLACNRIQRVVEQLPTTSHVEWSISPRFIPLLKPSPGELTPQVTAGRGGRLEKLRKFTLEMAQGTGCDQAQCVAHVLVGTPLLLRPIAWFTEKNNGCGLIHESATIQILAPHAVTFGMLKPEFRRIRERLGLFKKKAMKEWHLRLVNLVKKKGGIPQRGKTAFWRDIQRQWNKAVPKHGRKYTTWMGPRMAYNRIQSGLNKDASRNAVQRDVERSDHLTRHQQTLLKKAAAMAKKEMQRYHKQAGHKY